MDDLLEIPSSVAQKNPLEGISNDDDQSDEEGGLDWTKLLPSSARPTIPKRGEKEYEPRAAGGTNLQLHILDRSRNAMFETLRTTRSISSKAISYAIWHPDISRAEVTVARGIHFANMGHSAPRSVVAEDGSTKFQKRLELLPEEAIYLIERGALFCWKKVDLILDQVPGLNDIQGSPMSVQQAYSEIMNTEDLMLEKFQVYSYLRRLGYVVTRANPPDSHYPIPTKKETSHSHLSWTARITSLFTSWVSSTSNLILNLFRWWRPFRSLCHNKTYTSVFHSLRFIPAGHSIPLKNTKSTISSPYRIFYNIYKPSTPFRKSTPPQPDFQLVVVNARTTPVPTMQELTNLFEDLPEVHPQPRRPQPSHGAVRGASEPNHPQPDVQATKTTSLSTLANYLRQLFPWIFPQKFVDSSSKSTSIAGKPNPFAALKMGKKIIIIAAVDMGNISFFRFGQGEFSEWPMAT